MSFDVETVLAALSSNEKTSLLSGFDFWHTIALPQHNVPAVRCCDGPNGIRGTKFFAGVPAACLPCGTALGATWDTHLMCRAGEFLGRECIAKGAHCWLGPTINIQRSPLGGRGFESYSEDPHLSGILAASAIQGCESTGVQSVVKHFVCNDQEDERRAVDTLVTERALREIYARPFQIVARDANPGGLMTAYNKVNGCHVSQHPKLLDGLIRDEWGWDPLIMSDWYGTYSTEGALNAGLDLEMPGRSRHRGNLLDFALSSRLVTSVTIDKRVKRVLQYAKRASSVKVSEVEGISDLPSDRALNREICASSIVLLKNDDAILPLATEVTEIALIGSHMKSPSISGGGSASLDPLYTVSLFDAIKSRLPLTTKVHYEIGAYAHKMLPIVNRGMSNERNPAGGAVIRFFNEPPPAFTGKENEEEREIMDEIPIQNLYFQLMDFVGNPRLNHELFYATVEADFTPDTSGLWDFGLAVYGTANLYINDELIIDNTTDQVQGDTFFRKGTVENRGAIQMTAGLTYKLRIEFGSCNTSKLRNIGVVSFGGGGARLGACPRIDLNQAIEKAAQLASKCEYTILCTGLNADWESEGFDRKHMDLPPGVDKLISRVLAANPRTIIINQSGTPVSMPWTSQAKAIVQAWYGGNETGNGIADVLFGAVNPSAKLPLSWPVRLQDNPAFLNFGSVQGRVLYGEDVYVGYRYYDSAEVEPLFCFGHGLSYTTFSFSNVRVSQSTVTLEITNTGPCVGAEIVQIYIAPQDSTIQRPVKELHGFQKVFLKVNQTKTVEISIDRYATSLWDESERNWLSQRGTYKVLVGSSSKNIVLSANFFVEKDSRWIGL